MVITITFENGLYWTRLFDGQKMLREASYFSKHPAGQFATMLKLYYPDAVRLTALKFN